MLRPAAPNAKIIGFLDSPYYLDIEPYSDKFPGFPYEEQQKFSLYNTTEIISPECAEKYAPDEWKCQFGVYRMPLVKTPYFMIVR
jgi:hypothetical protein